MKSKLYNQEDGIIYDLDNITFDNKPFFRKTILYKIETDIARILKNNTHPNIVSIYNVTTEYIDMEILETNNNIEKNLEKDIPIIRSQMESVKNHLQKLGISYMDWKLDNIGFSNDTNQFKLFDFDACGLFDKENNNRWSTFPEPFNNLRYCISLNIDDPIKMDNHCFDHFSNFGTKYIKL
jgi:serine/threonine protein kinase